MTILSRWSTRHIIRKRLTDDTLFTKMTLYRKTPLKSNLENSVSFNLWPWNIVYSYNWITNIFSALICSVCRRLWNKGISARGMEQMYLPVNTWARCNLHQSISLAFMNILYKCQVESLDHSNTVMKWELSRAPGTAYHKNTRERAQCHILHEEVFLLFTTVLALESLMQHLQCAVSSKSSLVLSCLCQ